MPKGEGIYEFKSIDELIYVYVGTATPYSYNSEILIQIIPDNVYVKSGIWQIMFYPDSIKDGKQICGFPEERCLPGRPDLQVRFRKPHLQFHPRLTG